MPATLYGLTPSPHVARALLVAKYLKVDIVVKPVNLFGGEHKQEAYLSINPFGTIPAYTSEDGSLKLFESRAIARYLDISHGGKLLKINDHAAYAKVEQWAAVEVGSFSKDVGVLFVELIAKPNFRKLPTDQAAVDAALPELNKTLAVYEKHLASSKFLAGDDITIADLFHVPFLAPLVGHYKKDILDAFPHTKKWFLELVALPAWQEIVADQLAFLATLPK